MSTLYRKYRPQTFSDLIGQNHIKITLQNEIELGQIGHAYLFCGPRGLGKTTTARLFAKAINCLQRKAGESEPCNKCESCFSITSGSSVDIIEIDAASHTGVDKVRENIIENIRFSPVSSKYKVFIIDEVHMLSISAFNALLKTLEEPPEHAIFILCTTEIHKIPQTIISRCQRFDFRKVSKEELMKRLKYIIKAENKKVADKVLTSVIVYSEGCVRDAESLLGKILTLGDDITEEVAELVLPKSDFSLIISFLEFILERNTAAALELINRLVEDGVDLQIFTDNLIEFLRKVLLIKVGGMLNDFALELDENNEQAAERLAQRFDYAKLLSIIELLMAKRQELKSAFIQQFPLEMAVIEINEEMICECDDNFSSSGGSGQCLKEETNSVGSISSGESIKEKIKDRLAHLNPQKNKNTAEEKKVASSNKENKEAEEKSSKTDLPLSAEKSKPQNLVDFKEILKNWQRVVESLLEKNYTLASLLRISQPLKCDGRFLEIGIKSNFYKDRLEDTKNKKVIEETISEIFKTEVIIRGVVKDNLEPLETDNSNQVVSEIKKEEKIKQAEVVIEPMKIQKSGDVVQEVIGMF